MKSITTAKQLGEALREARVSQDLSQTSVGGKYRIPQKTVSLLEGGSEGTRLGTLFKILASLHLEIQLKRRDQR